MKNQQPYFTLGKNLRSLFVRAPEREAALDGIRAISILLVVAYHALAIPALSYPDGLQAYMERFPAAFRWLAQGDKGVDLFFVLSGFLIGRMLLTEQQTHGRIHFGEFYFRRLIRLSPAYLVLLLVFLLLPIRQNKIYLLANLFYVNNFLDSKNMIGPWTWSLAVEEQFYLVLPLFLTLFFFRSKHPWRLLAGLIVMAFAIRGLLFAQHPLFSSMPHSKLIVDGDYFESITRNLYTRYDGLLYGFCAAYLLFAHGARVREWMRRKPLHNVLATLGSLGVMLAILATPLVTMHRDWGHAALFAFRISHYSIFSAAAAVLTVCVLHAEGVAKPIAGFLSLRLWLPFAQLAYAIYLFHELFALLAWAITKSQRAHANLSMLAEAGMVLAITLVMSTIFAAVIYVFIEKPPMNRRAEWWRRLTQQRQVALKN